MSRSKAWLAVKIAGAVAAVWVLWWLYQYTSSGAL